MFLHHPRICFDSFDSIHQILQWPRGWRISFFLLRGRTICFSATVPTSSLTKEDFEYRIFWHQNQIFWIVHCTIDVCDTSPKRKGKENLVSHHLPCSSKPQDYLPPTPNTVWKEYLSLAAPSLLPCVTIKCCRDHIARNKYSRCKFNRINITKRIS